MTRTATLKHLAQDGHCERQQQYRSRAAVTEVLQESARRGEHVIVMRSGRQIGGTYILNGRDQWWLLW